MLVEVDEAQQAHGSGDELTTILGSWQPPLQFSLTYLVDDCKTASSLLVGDRRR
jgi:hypothetical protein